MSSPLLPIGSEIGQFLHPAHWDEHVRGDGDATPEIHAYPTNRQTRDAITQLRSYVQRSTAPVPIEQFQPGDTFDASAYIGAIIAIDNEKLALHDDLEIDPDGFDAVQPPKRLPLYLGSAGIHAGSLPYFKYAHQASIAAISRTRQEPHIIGSFTTIIDEVPLMGGMLRIPVSGTSLRFFPSVIEIGQVRHMHCDSHSTDVFERVNRVDILSPAQPQRSRSERWRTLARSLLRLQPQGA